ncbi:MAG: MmcQ/YjbR family DNA-binding protein [Thermoleophilia bacterium]|nr:MmcQ/YjbR family DNA-binding protein [Thermoleophilia bacterium]
MVVSAPTETLHGLRRISLRFPEAVEAGGVGNPSFKVRDKIFAMQHGHESRPSCWVKAPAGVQQLLVGHDPGRFFAPPYVGQHGWVGVWLDVDVDWDELADLVEESYRMTAPKRLLAQLDAVQSDGRAGED